MPRKIYDIKPPKLVGKTGEPKGKIPIEIKKRKKAPAQAAPRAQKKGSRSIWRPVLVCVLIVIIAVGTYLFFKLPKADIVIWPKVATLSFQQTIIADKSATSIDPVKAVIPAQYFQATKTDSQSFPATGNASNQGYASGTITIYNKYDPPTPFTLKAGTHFMSDSGKLFVAMQKIVIPAAKKIGNKVTPGSIQVNVQAVEGGTDYNIAPAAFSIPGLKGTAFYYSISATSSSPMTGGYSGKVKRVTDDDLQGAKDVLTQKTTSDAMSALKGQISSDYVLLDNAALSNVTGASTQTKSGTVADNFNYQVTVQASALAFKKSDLEQFAKNYILSKAPQGETLLDNSLKMDYSSSVVDVSGGKATFNLNFSSSVYQNIDKSSMALSLLGENANQIKETVNNVLGGQVAEIRINFWPFWVTSAPNNQKAVNVELKFQ